MTRVVHVQSSHDWACFQFLYAHIFLSVHLITSNTHPNLRKGKYTDLYIQLSISYNFFFSYKYILNAMIHSYCTYYSGLYLYFLVVTIAKFFCYNYCYPLLFQFPLLQFYRCLFLVWYSELKIVVSIFLFISLHKAFFNCFP